MSGYKISHNNQHWIEYEGKTLPINVNVNVNWWKVKRERTMKCWGESTLQYSNSTSRSFFHKTLATKILKNDVHYGGVMDKNCKINLIHYVCDVLYGIF
jgi:hypothetical protein